MLVQIFTPTIQEKLTEIIFRKTYGVSIKKNQVCITTGHP